MDRQKNVLVIDAQGGGLGKQLISAIRKEIDEEWRGRYMILAVGTNSAATAAMLKAGADTAATGENSVVVACKKADVIGGPLGIVMADAMLGEVTERMAAAVATAQARRILIPFSNCDTWIAGTDGLNMGRLIEDAVARLKLSLTEIV